DEVDGQRRRPAEPVGPEATSVERVEVFVEPAARDEPEAAGCDLLGQLRVTVLAETLPQEPVRVDPDGPAPVSAFVEPRTLQVEARDDVAVRPVRMEARRSQ